MEITNWTGCVCSAYAVSMQQDDTPVTSGKATPGRLIRLTDEMWADYGEACEAMGTNRSDDIRRHVAATIAAHKRELRRIARESGAAES